MSTRAAPEVPGTTGSTDVDSWLDLALRQTDQMVIITNLDGVVVWVNDAFDGQTRYFHVELFPLHHDGALVGFAASTVTSPRR